MKYVKTLGLLVIAAAAMMALPGIASATTATSPAGTTYSGIVTGESSNTKIHGSFITVECGQSHFEGQIETQGAGITIEKRIKTFSFKVCNYTITVTVLGKFAIHKGKVTVGIGLRIKIHTSIGECEFEPSNSDSAALTEGSGASIDLDSYTLVKTGGSFFCGSTAEWTGNYSINTPAYLATD